MTAFRSSTLSPMTAAVMIDSFSSSSKIGSLGRNGVVVGTTAGTTEGVLDASDAQTSKQVRTFVHARGDVEHEAEFSL